MERLEKAGLSKGRLFLFFLLTILFSVIVGKGVWAIELPETGQTTCYDTAGSVIACPGTGQDGDWLAGVAWPGQRFTTNPDTTITDNLTGLSWAPDGGTPTVVACAGGIKTWQGALDYVACLNANNYLDHNDWRLSNVNELESLIHSGQAQTYAWLNTQGFSNVQDAWYWTSTTSLTYNPSYAWGVEMSDGYVDPDNGKYSGNLYVLPVRGTSAGPAQLWKTGQTTCYDTAGSVIACPGTGQDGDWLAGVAWPGTRFTVSGDCVTDILTGLTWAKNADLPNSAMPWQQALDYANGLSLCGYTDWRLPNRKELFSLIDFSQVNPALPTEHPFTNILLYNQHWTSTTMSPYTYHAWSLYIGSGGIMNRNKTSSPEYVWPVRGGTVCVQPPSGLVSWWGGDNNALDMIGTNNGTLMNGATFAAGKVGQAFSFDGVDDYVEVPHNASLSFSPTSPMTVDLWAYRTSSSNGHHLLAKRAGCGSNDMNYQLHLNQIGLCFVGTDAGGNMVCTTGGLSDLPLNTWTHIAGTFDGSTLRLFINGQMVASNPSATLGPQNSAPLTIGALGSCSSNYPFGGLIDEVSIYNRGLSASEIAAIYNAGSAGKCKVVIELFTLFLPFITK